LSLNLPLDLPLDLSLDLSLAYAGSASDANPDNRVQVDNGLPLLLLSNHVGIRCYRADPGKCCRWSRTMDILNFPQSSGDHQRRVRKLAWRGPFCCLVARLPR
jgi:hypothetical protein